ncbi:amino acid adenylation domain-containing protein [Paenibacillus sp. 102]|uniref:amino acid adenylation domain-containing protein n=1 Tax=Paenibacillus sp. 102 TaxID=3120823 RepID=UPI0031BA79BE
MFDKRNIKDLYELSPMQKGMLFHALKDEEAPSHFVQGYANLYGVVDPNILEESFNGIIQKYDVLRTVFLYEKLNKPIQVVLKERKASLHFEDISHLKEEEKIQYLENFRENSYRQGFNLTRDILIRLSLIKVVPNQYQLIWDFHHILMDGWCWGLVFDDLLTMYQQRMNGQEIEIQSVMPYSEYIKWLNNQDYDQGRGFWKRYLSGYEQSVVVPQQIEGNGHKYTFGEVKFQLDEEITYLLEQFAKQHKVTLNSVFQTIWGVLLQKYNQTDDVVFGAVVSGRPTQIHNIESIVGLFINTLPVRVKNEKQDSFVDLLYKVHQMNIEAKDYEYISLSDIQVDSDCFGQLINHIIVFENYLSTMDTVKQKSEKNGFSFVEGGSFEPNNYDLSVIVHPNSKLTVSFEFNQEVYSQEFIENISQHLKKIIVSILENPYTLIRDIEILPEKEKNLLMIDFNQTDANYPEDKTIQDLFEEQVRQNPENVALVYNNENWTYKQLNSRANQVARVLQRNGVGREVIVGILMDRSLELIAGILGVLKAGGSYLPIDPSYPTERIQYTLEDSETDILLVCKSEIIPEHYNGKVIVMEEINWDEENTTNLLNLNEPSDLAYIIYTSGSTGNPKGVMIEHRNVVRLLFNDNNLFDFNANDIWTMFHSMCFDFSVWEMYGALLYGGKLIIVPPNVARDTTAFLQLLKEHRVTVLNQTPSAFYVLSNEEMLCENEKDVCVRNIIFGGEALVPSQLKEWKGKYPATKLINMYGITETTVHVTYKEINTKEIERNVSNIGTPIPTLKAYILDRNKKLLPLGVPGELYVSGEGVGRGYLNRSELTRERFIENPFLPGERMYKSGDLARWLPNGEMEYLGRIDDQVKIRGHRIELGEVTGKLLTYEGIKEGIVVARKDNKGMSYLCAYFTSDETCNVSKIRQYMIGNLPEYMVPSYFIELQLIPVTSNGKVNRKALPEPMNYRSTEVEYVAPGTAIEFALSQIYQELLDIEQIGVHDNFLELGGHSLKATMLVSRINKTLEVAVPLKEVFLRPTIKEMAAYIQELESHTSERMRPAIQQEYYPVTSQQKRIYAIQEFDNTGLSYNVPFAFDVKGDLDVEQLRNAIHLLIERHQVLCTSFYLMDGELVQKIHADIDINIPYIEAQNLNFEEMLNDFIKPFNFAKDSLFRARIVKISNQHHILLFDIHHIIVDGISINILMQDLSLLYQNKLLPVLQIQYIDYAMWQQEWFQSEEFKEVEAYWIERFSGELPILDLPTDYVRPSIQKFDGRNLLFELDKEVVVNLKKLAIDTGTTLYISLIAAYNILLSKYTGQEDVIIGSPLSGRLNGDIENTVGMFANVLPLRTKVDGDTTFKELIAEIKENLFNAYEHSEYPLERLLEKLDIQRDISRNPLFETIFTLQDTGGKASLEIPALAISSFEMEDQASKFDLAWELNDNGEVIRCNLTYNKHLFKDETIERMVEHFTQILLRIIDNPSVAIKEIDMLTVLEKRNLLLEFNNTTANYAKEKTIIELFEERVEKSPHRIAAISGEKKYTYYELNKRANQLARVLRKKGLKRNEIAAIMTYPSLDMLVGVLGILKAGGAYLPIDATYPMKRVHYLLEDSKTKFLLVQEQTSKPTVFDGEIINVNNEQLYEENGENIETINAADDLAYVIYTSGSTGKPKGVMIKHHSVNNLCLIAQELKIDKDSRVLQFASFSFDASVWEIFPAIISGATLYIEDKQQLLGTGFTEWLKENKITTVTLPPSVLRSLPYEDFPDLVTIVTAGEPCSLDLVQVWGRKYNFINAYGPTETTVCATLGHLNPEVRSISIGKPIHNTKVYIVDKNNQLQPIGVPGQLCVSGEGLARGYLNRSQLTEEQFIDNPFEPGTKMYKTGDLARWLSDGNIEYLGRIDNQVKIRGHRIEINEITERLLQHENIKEAVVIPVEEENKNKSLYAYIVFDKACSVSLIRRYLSMDLPNYMIPSYFIEIADIPLTANGKLDVKALPKPVVDHSLCVLPTTEEERILEEIWTAVLEVTQVSIHDNFFEIGGDSIKAIQIAAKLKQYNLKLQIKNIFEYPTIYELAHYVQQHHAQTENEIVTGETTLTPIQNWVFELTSNPSHWNQAVMLMNEKGWNIQAVQNAIRKITEHHDALRMVYVNGKDCITQVNQGISGSHFTMKILDLTNEEHVENKIQQEANLLQRSIDLSEGPLVKTAIFQTKQEDHLLIIINHLVIDAVSWRVIMEDFENLYMAELNKEEYILPDKTTSFQMWSRELEKYASSDMFLKELPYWKRLLNESVDKLPVENASLDYSHMFKEMDMIDLRLTEAETTPLLTQVHATYNTEINDILLAALALTIKEWTNSSKVSFDMEGHGREEVIDNVDVTRTVGWFTSFSPIIFNLETNNLSQIIPSVKETLRQVPNKGIGYSILRFLTPQEKKESIEFNLQPEIMFNYLGQFQNGLEQEEIQSSSMPLGDLIDPMMNWNYKLDINGYVVDGKLEFTFRFNKHLFSYVTIENLVKRYKYYLKEIIQHCENKELLQY